MTDARQSADQYVTMDVVGTVEGADKSSAVKYEWDYLRHYEPLFSPYRDVAINLVEVGVLGGASLRLWQWYFTKANIIGVDINPKCRAHATERVKIAIGSQADAAFLTRICREAPPTIFIDDGSHVAEHNVFTFEHVFPMLLPGGLYVVEDLAFHFGGQAGKYQGAVPRNSPEYFLDLARSCVARRAVDGRESVPDDLLKIVDSVMFIGSAVVIRKKFMERNLEHAVSVAQHYIQDVALDATAYGRLGKYIARHKGDPAWAEAVSRAGLETGTATIKSFVVHAELLLKLKRGTEAIAMLQQAAALGDKRSARDRETRRMLIELANLQERLGLLAPATKTFTKILAEHPGNVTATKGLERLRIAAARPQPVRARSR